MFMSNININKDTIIDGKILKLDISKGEMGRNSGDIQNIKENKSNDKIEDNKKTYLADKIEDLLKIEPLVIEECKNLNIQELLALQYNLNLKNLKTVVSILKNLQDKDDVGEYFKIVGTGATAAGTVIANVDCVARFRQGVKSYTLINDGQNNILIGHNVTGVTVKTSADLDTNLKFQVVTPNQVLRVVYNRNVINTISYLTLAGTSNFRLTLSW